MGRLTMTMADDMVAHQLLAPQSPVELSVNPNCLHTSMNPPIGCSDLFVHTTHARARARARAFIRAPPPSTTLHLPLSQFPNGGTFTEGLHVQELIVVDGAIFFPEYNSLNSLIPDEETTDAIIIAVEGVLIK